MKNQHTVRNPRVLVMKDAATHVEVTADCEKVREPHLYDTLMGGITLRHSEMQAMPTTLAASIYRGFCKNQYLSGFHKSDSRYQGDIPVPAIWYKQSSNIASVLGSLLNRMDRLSRQPCVATEMAIALLSSRWNFAPETTTVLYEIANDKYLRSYRFQGDESLYDVLNTITAVTTHRRHRTNRRDCRILGQLSDALLTQHSPLQRLLCTDLHAPVERHFEISEYTGELDDIEIDDWYDDFLPGR